MTTTPHAAYDDFFRAAFDGRDPFDYQRRLATEAELPSLAHVPTGAGKTYAVLGAWLWRRMTNPESVGRRLIYCLPMRTLVEQTRDNAKKAIKALSLDDRFRTYMLRESEVDGDPHCKGCNDRFRFRVHTLMGGEVERRRKGKVGWDAKPERECIIIGTQDMLLSRALNRGYAMSRYKWPVHFGLLTNDCLWVFDEVQLMGNGLATSTQLAAFRQEFKTLGRAHSVWMSATLKRDWLETVDWKDKVGALEAVSLSEADRGSAILAARLKAVKALRQADERCRLPKGLAGFAKDRHQPGTQTLVVVNTVKRAREAYQELGKLYSKTTDAPQLELIHSRFRPAERKSWPALLKDKSYIEGAGRIIVATQVVEAGVDISSRLLVTDLAPFSSLVQRFGRCNREGEHEQAEIFWVDRPATREKVADKSELDENDKRELAKPYDWQELETAQKLIENLNSASPDALGVVPYDEPYRPTHVLRRRDLVDLFDTTPDLSGYDLDISRFVRDTDERDVAVAWRELKGKKPEANERRPARDELCAVPIHELKAFLSEKIKAWAWDALEGEWDEVKPDGLRPGMTVLLDAKSGGYDPKLGWSGKEAKKAVPVINEDRGSKPEEAYADDHWSFPDYAQELSAHSLETRRMLEGILERLKLPDVRRYEAELLTAAQHHDWGKAHKIFQQTLHGAETAEQEFSPLLAKSKSNHKHKRPKFRHELASALALLQTRESDLTVYLAACHHGKVRLSIRALPGERKPEDAEGKLLDRVMFARGIWDGEALPTADLGDGLKKERVVLNLEPMLLGSGEDGSPSWLERMIALRDDLGVFRLAFLEALIRAADVRASAFPEDKLPDEEESE